LSPVIGKSPLKNYFIKIILPVAEETAPSKAFFNEIL
jgi:hypothetical protein